MTWEFETEPEFQKKLDWAREFVRSEIYPLETLEVGWDDFYGIIEPLKQEVKDHGLWAVFLPSHLGGAGWGQMHMALLSEVLGETLWAPMVFGSRAPDTGNAELLAHGATAAQRERWLQPSLEGKIRSCFAMTEPGAGADPTGISTTAVLDGDEWVLNGQKWFASNATSAAYLLVVCKTEMDAAPTKRFSVILVPADTPGLNIARDIPALDDANRHFRGVQPDTHSEVFFENVRVPADHLVGERGGGWRLAQLRLGPGRIHHCMRWLGQMNRAFNMLCERAVSRTTFGERLADRQIVQDWITESYAQMQAARLLTLNAAWKIDTYGLDSARKEISLIKFWGARALHDVIDRSIQIHGSLGYSGDLPLESMYRLARAARIYDGPDEVHKGVVAKALLKEFTHHDLPSEHVPTRRKAAYERWGHLITTGIPDA